MNEVELTPDDIAAVNANNAMVQAGVDSALYTVAWWAVAILGGGGMFLFLLLPLLGAWQ